VVDVIPAASTPNGSTINVSNFGGGCYWTYRQHPPGAHHRCFTKPGTCCQNFSSDIYQGAIAVNITATSKQLGGKMEARVSAKIFWVLAVPRTQEL
jgi:hypothetical protein